MEIWRQVAGSDLFSLEGMSNMVFLQKRTLLLKGRGEFPIRVHGNWCLASIQSIHYSERQEDEGNYCCKPKSYDCVQQRILL